MSMDYIRRAYTDKAKRGCRVRVISSKGERRGGVITGASGSMIRVRLDGEHKSRLFHPTWNIEYLPD